MPCYHPLKGYKTPDGALTFKSGGTVSHMQVACGQCIGCRIDRTRHWAMRCVHESKKHQDNCFITLTYAPEHLPYGGTLVKKDFQDFMKRLRKSLGHRKVSFFHCGEYGELLSRPHYHALLFGHDFMDKTPWKKSHTGDQIYVSKTLEKLWGKGHCSIGAVTELTAAYTAGYIFKKITGDLAKDHYKRLLPDGSIIDLQPEYITMSTRPAIGVDWIDTYVDEVYRSDTVIFRGRETKPPRFYDKQLRKLQEGLYETVKSERTDKRLSAPEKQKANNREKRLKVREQVAHAKTSLFKRNLS